MAARRVKPRWDFLLGQFGLLDKADVGRLAAAFGGVLNRSELGFVAGDIFPQRAPDALGVPWTDNHAGEKFALRAVRKNINKIQGELFQLWCSITRLLY